MEEFVGAEERDRETSKEIERESARRLNEQTRSHARERTVAISRCRDGSRERGIAFVRSISCYPYSAYPIADARTIQVQVHNGVVATR